MLILLPLRVPKILTRIETNPVESISAVFVNIQTSWAKFKHTYNMSLFDIFYDSYSFRRRKWLILVSTTVYSIVIISYIFFFKDFTQKTDSKFDASKQEFFILTDKLLYGSDSSLISIETIRHSFNSVDRKTDGVLQKYGFINVLEDYLVYLLSLKEKINKEKFNTITEIIRSELQQEPFTQLKSDQRRVMKNLESSINSKDSTIALYNLAELNDIIRNLNVDNEQLEKQNNWSLPLAIVGLIMTILFGLVSILRPISLNKIKKIVDESNKGKTLPNKV